MAKAARVHGVKVRPGDRVVVTLVGTVQDYSHYGIYTDANTRPDEIFVMVKGPDGSDHGVWVATDDTGEIRPPRQVTVIPVKGE